MNDYDFFQLDEDKVVTIQLYSDITELFALAE